jgi:hypothetical protein
MELEFKSLKNIRIDSKESSFEILEKITSIAKLLNKRITTLLHNNQQLMIDNIGKVLYLTTDSINTDLFYVVSAGFVNAEWRVVIHYIAKENGKFFVYREGIHLDIDKTEPILTIYPPHFFERYSQRMNINKKGLALIEYFIKNNTPTIEIIRAYMYNGEKKIVVSIKDGVGIADRIIADTHRTYICKTFLNYNLLFHRQKDVYLKVMKEITEADEIQNENTQKLKNARNCHLLNLMMSITYGK